MTTTVMFAFVAVGVIIAAGVIDGVCRFIEWLDKRSPRK